MKIIVVKGSPHRKGSSNLLAEQFIRGAREAGHAIVELDAAHMDIHPCLGCERCGMNGPCAQKDDVPQIRDALLECVSKILGAHLRRLWPHFCVSFP